MIEINKLTFSYPAKTVFKDLDLHIGDKEFVAIIGPSGCGKTTLLKILADLVTPFTGSVMINKVAPHDFRMQRGYTYMFQDATLLPWLTVRQNIELPLVIKKDTESAQKAEAIMNLLGLDAFKDTNPSELSGGQKQRVALGRALVCPSDLILMDEPFASLDEFTREALGEQLLKIHMGSEKATVLFVTHNIEEAVFLSTRIIVMSKEGKILGDLKNELTFPRDSKVKLKPLFYTQCQKVRSVFSSTKS